MDNGGISLAGNDFNKSRSDTFIVNFQLSIVH